MKVFWIGLIVPKDMSDRLAQLDRYITAQTQTFQSRVVRSIELDPANRVAIVASPPATDWSAVRITGLRRWSHRDDGTTDVVVPMINITGLKQLTVFAGCLIGALWAACRAPRDPAVIVVADSYFPHLLAGACASWLLRLPVFAIITDMPGLLSVTDPWPKRWLRPLDTGVVRGLLRHMDGLVVLSEHIARDFFPDRRYLVMPGIVETTPLAADASPGFVIMYSGALMPEYGLGLLLEAFALLPPGTGKLWVTGRGDFEPQVRAAAARNPQIEFLGYLPAAELARRLSRATVLVSLRISHQGHARYSFPSKLLEYMLTPAFVITNRFPSLPEDYARHLLVLEEESAPALAGLLQRIHDGGCGDRAAFAARMQAFIRERASMDAEGRRLTRFLQGTQVAVATSHPAP